MNALAFAVPGTCLSPGRHQRGFSLVVTLVLLAMVMVLGLSGYQLSNNQVTLSGNVQFRTSAFNEAEASVAAAEQWLATTGNAKSVGFTTYSSGTGLYPSGYMATNSIDPLTMTWSDTNSKQAGAATQRYVIEQLAANKVLSSSGLAVGGRTASGCSRVNTFRIVGRGEGGRGAQVFVQTVYSVLGC